jgi:hypothetical protein
MDSTARKSSALVRYTLPHPDAEKCGTCGMWWVPYTTQIFTAGWYLCSQCHDGPCGKSFAEVPWEQRRIRVLGVKGSPEHVRLHEITMEPTSERQAGTNGGSGAAERAD